jgi:hypothetical protein
MSRTGKEFFKENRRKDLFNTNSKRERAGDKAERGNNG